MTKYRINTGTQLIEFPSLELAQSYNTENNTSLTIETITESSPSVDIASIIDEKILYYQTVAPKLVRELYVANTLAGISSVQSDQMFDDFADVLLRLREGAFPTAMRRILLKRPSGFVTQSLLDAWVTKIQAYI